jgi:hypothetical protein
MLNMPVTACRAARLPIARVNVQILAAQEQIPNALFPRRARLILILTKSRGDKPLDDSREEDSFEVAC